jgi:hypothetical protein
MALSGEYYDMFFVTQITRATALAHIVAVDRVRVEPERHSGDVSIELITVSLLHEFPWIRDASQRN